MKTLLFGSLALMLGLAVAAPNAFADGPTGLKTKQYYNLTGKVLTKSVTTAEAVSLNPQPLPPKQLQVLSTAGGGGTVSLNPQPLPPKFRSLYLHRKPIVGNPGGPVSLNPQPLPPKTIYWLGK